jgi:spore maturation protein CgeB
VFTYRKANVEVFRKAGFEQAEYLPLATHPRRRAPVSLPDAERAAYASEVSFVGSSMVAQASAYRKQFCSLYAAWKKSPAAAAEAEALLSEGLVLQRNDFSRFVLKDFLEQHLGGFLGAAHALDPLMLAGEVAASEKRLLYLKALAGASVDVWGDAGWQQASAPHLRYRGQAGHFVELNKIYSHSKINLDIGRIYQSDIVTMRVFDVLACGGFLLAEHSEALGELFAVGEEIESYSTREELSSKVSFYLAHPEKARALAERGRKAVLERHTIAGRLRHMLGS